jgi:hypothetical protein
MRANSAKVISVRGLTAKARWGVWLLGGVLALGDAALLVPCGRADGPTDQPRARPRGEAAAKRVRKPKPPVRRGTAQAPRARRREAAETSARRSARAQKASDEPALDLATGPDDACHLQLRKAGVSFVKVGAERAPNVALPIRLTSHVAGVEIRGTGKNKATHYLDCRLALALVRWAPELLTRGIVGIDHYSIYRPDAAVGGTRKPSGHALALAIDAGRFHLRDGRVLTVLDAWSDKTKGAEPCTARPQQSADEHLLRELVCDASRHGVFQTVVTPHHNPAHDNHVHLEVGSPLDPTWIH